MSDFTRFRILFYCPGVVYDPVYARTLEAARRKAIARFGSDFMPPRSATIEVSHEEPRRGKYPNWKLVEIRGRDWEVIEQK